LDLSTLPKPQFPQPPGVLRNTRNGEDFSDLSRSQQRQRDNLVHRRFACLSLMILDLNFGLP
jgi:hypothetical protein